jgi:hypothetical protein
VISLPAGFTLLYKFFLNINWVQISYVPMNRLIILKITHRSDNDQVGFLNKFQNWAGGMLKWNAACIAIISPSTATKKSNSVLNLLNQTIKKYSSLFTSLDIIHCLFLFKSMRRRQTKEIH